MAKLALYLIGIYGLLGAIVAYEKRRNALRRPPVKQLAAQLQQAWAQQRRIA